MLRTPVSSTVRRLNAGHRSSAARSSMANASCSDIASRHGPSPTSYWMASTRDGMSSVAETLSIPPRRRMIEIAAWSQPSTVATAARVTRSRVVSDVPSACS